MRPQLRRRRFSRHITFYQQLQGGGLTEGHLHNGSQSFLSVVRPEDVRILAVPAIPLPEEVDLRQAAQAFGLITPRTGGLTIGHGILVRQDCLNDAKLIAHELMHVAQYERLGSILAFLQRYLWECNEVGYPAAPMEQEAIAFAESVFPASKYLG